MVRCNRFPLTLGLAALAVCVWSPSIWAQTETGAAAATLPAAEQPVAEPQPNPAESLALEQQRIADKYKHLEGVLLRMAELSGATDPRRAALLKKVVGQSKERLVTVRLEQIVELLGNDRLSRALENQTELDRDLRVLLKLLLSENRAKRIKNEKARIREYLKQINAIIRQQKDIQGRTGGGDDPPRLTGEQGKLAERTGKLADDIRNTEEPKGDNGESKEQPGEKKTPGQGKKPGEAEGQPGQSKPQDASPASARERLESAQRRMKEAEAKLQQAQRQGAAEKQEEAILELQKAKADLEEILRQLREEEIERMLAMLEARFRAMLLMQEEVYEGTVRLDRVPSAERTHNHEIEASRLSGKESQILVELDKALLVLRDDGTAVAFLEATRQMGDDVQQIVERLARAEVGPITQGIEEDVIAALKEMIEALKNAKEDQQKKPPPGQSPGQMSEPPLVDLLAELRMIRALQMRVKNRTVRYSKLIEGEQAENAELVEALRRLAERQERIYRVTHDLHTGRNQ